MPLSGEARAGTVSQQGQRGEEEDRRTPSVAPPSPLPPPNLPRWLHLVRQLLLLSLLRWIASSAMAPRRPSLAPLVVLSRSHRSARRGARRLLRAVSRPAPTSATALVDHRLEQRHAPRGHRMSGRAHGARLDASAARRPPPGYRARGVVLAVAGARQLRTQPGSRPSSTSRAAGPPRRG